VLTLRQWFGTPTPEEEQAKGVFFGWAMNFVEMSKGFNAHFDAAKAKFTGIDSWGTIGLCWGGKVSRAPLFIDDSEILTRTSNRSQLSLLEVALHSKSVDKCILRKL
jgi:hypothetical protein